MPFQSEKQRRYLHANHPEIAKRWEKEYSHGGILDITGDEEITTEEGNDISLVDESETGVSTLFMKKGGRVPFQGGGRDASQADFGGSPSGGSAQGGDDKSYQSEPREIGIQQAYEVTGPAAAKERQRQDELRTLVETGPGSPIEKYDTKEQHLADTPGDLLSTSPRYNSYKSRLDVEYSQKNYERALANQQAALEKMGLQKLGKMGVALAAMVGLYNVPFMDAVKALPKTLSVTKTDLKSLFKESLTVMKAKQELIESLTNHQGGLLKDVDITNPNEMVNLEQTTDFTKTRDQLTELTTIKEDDPDSGPAPISPLPVGGEEETDAYAQTDYGNTMWRDNQALYAQLSKKWEQEKADRDAQYAELTKENPIGTETEIIALRNSGGLANLFRVKNQ